ncbi:MAG: hypothetical protein HY606_14960 [Planctomycetes bacterium]|nr:hypothetical protein [Planctomycetota bacterium]
MNTPGTILILILIIAITSISGSHMIVNTDKTTYTTVLSQDKSSVTVEKDAYLYVNGIKITSENFNKYGLKDGTILYAKNNCVFSINKGFSIQFYNQIRFTVPKEMGLFPIKLSNFQVLLWLSNFSQNERVLKFQTSENIDFRLPGVSRDKEITVNLKSAQVIEMLLEKDPITSKIVIKSILKPFRASLPLTEYDIIKSIFNSAPRKEEIFLSSIYLTDIPIASPLNAK